MPERRHAAQLSLAILPHPELAKREADGDPTWIVGRLEAKLDLRVGQDYNAGDEFLVTVTGADGELVGRVTLEVEYVVPKPIREKGLGIIGMERIHKAKIVDEAD